MPQFELAPTSGPTVFVRARAEEEAVRRHLGEESGGEVELGEGEPGTGWREVRVAGGVWGRVRPRDRMRFRRD